MNGMGVLDRISKYRGTYIKGEWPSITEQFRLTTQLYPDKTAFIQFSPEEIKMTYKESLLRIRRIAGWLISNGLQEGERVALVGPNTIYWALSFFAILEAGGVVVPINPLINTSDTEYLLKKTETRFLFAEREKFKTISKEKTGLKFITSLSEDYGNYILDLKPDKQVKLRSRKENDLAAILFTSGTTGMGKGVLLSHKNLMADVYFGTVPDGNIPVTNEDVPYAQMPLSHSLGLMVLLTGITHGNKTVFATEISVAQMFRDLELGGVTLLVSVPLLYNRLISGLMREIRNKGALGYRLIKFLMVIGNLSNTLFRTRLGKAIIRKLVLEKAQLHRIKYMLSGGSALSPVILKTFQSMGMNLVQGYGLTEASAGVTLNTINTKKRESVGRVLPFVDIAILDPDEKGIGEVCLKGLICSQGYLAGQEVKEEMYDSDGWLHTGDLGYLDKDNYLYLTGRSKNLIVTEDGQNIYPEEIEDKFQINQMISQVMIHSYLADKTIHKEGIEAVILPNFDFFRDKNMEDIKKMNKLFVISVRNVNRTLPNIKRVTKIRIINEEMPMTPARKIKRVLLTEGFLDKITTKIIDI